MFHSFIDDKSKKMYIKQIRETRVQQYAARGQTVRQLVFIGKPARDAKAL